MQHEKEKNIVIYTVFIEFIRVKNIILEKRKIFSKQRKKIDLKK